MIKQLRKHLMILFMILLSIIFFGLIISINIVNYNFNIQQQIRTIRTIIRRTGVEGFCSAPEEDSRYEDWKYGTVSYSKNNDSVILVNFLEKHNDQTLIEYADKILTAHSYSGRIDSLVYVRNSYNDNPVIIFVSNDHAIQNSLNLFILSLIFGLLGFVLLFLLSAFLSRKLTMPVEQSLESQKRFISDAGHELKTPLTIIHSNLDLLEEELGYNKHLQYIRSESKRMTHLVTELLSLAKIENTNLPNSFSTFSLSKSLMGVSLPFESIAYEKEIDFQIQIDNGLLYYGNKEQIQRLLSILLDNAFQHTEKNGMIAVHVSSSHNNIQISVSNTGKPIPEEIYDKIFQRFYRMNESRSDEQPHYGLGLSIAKSITDRHHGKISVFCDNGITTFQVVLSAK